MLHKGFLFSHAICGISVVLVSLWILVELLHASEKNIRRIRRLSVVVMVLACLALVLGGTLYISFYSQIQQAVVKAGPWSWAHSFFMEVKEHIVFLMLLLSLYLPVVLYENPVHTHEGARKLSLIITALLVILGLWIEGFGAIVSMGVRVGLGE